MGGSKPKAEKQNTTLKSKKRRKGRKKYLLSYHEVVFIIVLMCVCFNVGFYASKSDIQVGCDRTGGIKNDMILNAQKRINEELDEMDIIDNLVEERVEAGKFFI